MFSRVKSIVLITAVVAATLFITVPSAHAAKAKKPGKVTSIKVVASNKTLKVTWAKGSGGAPTSYIATLTPSAKKCTVTKTTCAFTGLTNGTNYTISIVAKNSAGKSMPVAVKGRPKSSAVTPVPTPSGWKRINGYLVGAGANLTNANLKSADLSGMNLTGVNLSNAKLENANLSGANLTQSNLSGADASNADFSNCILSTTNLIGANLSGAKSKMIKGSNAQLPEHWRLTMGYLVGPKANLSGTDFSNTQNPVLKNANLSGANLRNTRFYYADLTNADLTNADLTGAQIQHTSLDGTNLAGTTLVSVNTKDVRGVPESLPMKYVLKLGLIIGPYVDLGRAYLSTNDAQGIDLSGMDLTGINLQFAFIPNAKLVGTNLTNSNLSGTALNGSNLFGADLSGANFDLGYVDSPESVKYYLENLRGVKAHQIKGQPTLPNYFHLINGVLFGRGSNLDGANLSNQNLNNIVFDGASVDSTDFSNSTFSNSSFNSVDLRTANLKDASFKDADLAGTNFAGMDLQGMDFSNSRLALTNLTTANASGANFTHANIQEAILSGTNLAYANLDYVTSREIVGLPNQLPERWTIRSGYLIGPTAILRESAFFGTDLTGADFTEADLTDSALRNVKLDDAIFTDANLTRLLSLNVNGEPSSLPIGWEIRGGYLVGPGAYLAAANLSDVDLSNTNLDGAILTEANMMNTNLGGADLSNVVSGKIFGSPISLPTDWKLLNGYLIGPKANLIRAWLPEANLEKMNLTGAYFGLSNLSGANLKDVNLKDVNLRYANLTGADLSGADLSGANLRDSNLSNAISSEITGTPLSLPTGWALVNGSLVQN